MRRSLTPTVESEGYGARLQAAAAYQTPKSRLAAPSAGIVTVDAAANGREESARPNPAVTTAIETAVKAASRRSDATATVSDGIAARSRIPTPALPPIPCTSPMPNAPRGVRTP